MPISELSTSSLLGEDVVLELAELPAATATVTASSASGTQWAARREGATVVLSGLDAGTHAVEAWSADGELLAEEFTTVSRRPCDNPVVGFATSLEDASRIGPVLEWLKALRCTVVQVYDWMERYAAPLSSSEGYRDRLGRKLSLAAVRRLTSGIAGFGGVAQAYSPVYAVDPEFGETHPEMLLYRGDGRPQSLGDLLQIADPGRADWQSHWLRNYGSAADALGFGAFHLDTYGYPRAALDASGRPVELEASYASFLAAVRAARPGEVLSFNQVNGVPRGLPAPGPPGFRYVEVWPPNTGWRHLEGLLARSAGGASRQGDTLAIYPAVWAGDRASAMRTVVLSEAVVTSLGAGCLLYGDRQGVLRHPYYPDYERLGPGEADEALRWHRFSLRCRDLFSGGTDTSWYDLGDENGATSVAWGGAVSCEPLGGALFARVRRSPDLVAVSLVDLTGNKDGCWSSPSGPGRSQEASVTVLVDSLDGWRVEIATVGSHQGRFVPVEPRPVEHREGRALEVGVPLGDGWSVLRMTRRP